MLNYTNINYSLLKERIIPIIFSAAFLVIIWWKYQNIGQVIMNKDIFKIFYGGPLKTNFFLNNCPLE